MTARLELKNFLAGRGVVAALLLLLAAGMAATEQGRRTIAAQRDVLASSPGLEQEHRSKMRALHEGKPADGPGNLLYYLNLFTERHPSAYAPLAVGLRDLAPYNLKVRMLALEGQLYNAETGNPETQLLGNFDLAFLLGLLYPLAIIAFLHNVISAEQESGTWAMVRSHPVAIVPLAFGKALVRFVPLVAAWMVTLLGAAWYLRLPFDERLIAVLLLSVTYLLFWFSLTMLVAGLGRSSTFNALSLLSLWLALSILVPAAVNLGIQSALPASSVFEIAVRQREGYHGKWDRPRGETMEAFYARYPEHARFQAPEDRFSWGWYYAMQQMGDEEAAAASLQWRQTLEQREAWARRLAVLAPPALVQSALSRVAATDLPAHVAYLQSVRRYHESVRRFFYPLLFREPPIPGVEWGRLPRHRFADDERKDGAVDAVVALAVMAAGALLAAMALLRRN